VAKKHAFQESKLKVCFLKITIIAKKAFESDSKSKIVCVSNKPIVSDVFLDDHVFHGDGW
jgi:hypothetical protein